MPTRRQFLTALAATVATPRPRTWSITPWPTTSTQPTLIELPPDRLLGALRRDGAPVVLPGAVGYVASAPGDGLLFTFPTGTLAPLAYLTVDLLLSDFFLAVFELHLKQGEHGPTMTFGFGLIGDCQARLRVPLWAAGQNQWAFEREGALIKPTCGGDRIDLHRVDRIELVVLRKVEGPIRWSAASLRASTLQPTLLRDPLLPHGLLLDELGQTTRRDWPGKSATLEYLRANLAEQSARAETAAWPTRFSRYGGDDSAFGKNATTRPSTGFFRTEHDGHRWWLIDPDGRRFWSTGVDCVAPSVIANVGQLEAALPPAGRRDAVTTPTGRREWNCLQSNLAAAFGPTAWRDAWNRLTIAHLRNLGFNTIGNWSDESLGRAARFPYVRSFYPVFSKAGYVFRDFPDVFSDGFYDDCRAAAAVLQTTVDDPALLGYFVMNEPTWAFTRELPAVGMLYDTARCATRTELARILRQKYTTDAGLAAAWGTPATFAAVEQGYWPDPFLPPALADLEAFSTTMVDRLFGELSRACRAVDPHHLNLGSRHQGLPPPWALAGMKSFDVFSFNCYEKQVPAQALDWIEQVTGRPTLVGEFHFGALDAGLPGSGIGRVATQADRGAAFQFYVEQAAAVPQCVGVHYFQLYDDSALGRFDGENYQIGFLDVCNQPYVPLAAAARATHERLYDVASGKLPPIAMQPEYLPILFC